MHLIEIENGKNINYNCNCKKYLGLEREVKIMLSDFVDESLISLKLEASDWEDAIRKSAAPLLHSNKISNSYIDAMIKMTKEAGPYIVITKNVALPHARPETGAREIAIGIATLKYPVEFGNKDNDPVKYIFCLSATDSESHVKAMAELVELLDKADFFDVLDKAENPRQVMKFIKAYES